MEICVLRNPVCKNLFFSPTDPTPTNNGEKPKAPALVTSLNRRALKVEMIANSPYHNMLLPHLVAQNYVFHIQFHIHRLTLSLWPYA